MQNKPTALAYGLVILLIVGCIYGGYWVITNKARNVIPQKEIDLGKAKDVITPTAATSGITTQTSYDYVPNQKLPEVKGASSYKWNANDPVVVFPINQWIGWLPIVAANRGFNANKESIFYQKYKFCVQLKLIDDPVVARDTYVAGESHVLWGTLDMMALFAHGLMKDSRTSPRIYQQIDWSNGGDGIVVRDNIKSVSDLAGKTITYAQNSPSEYYLNTLLLSGGVQPKFVSHKYTKSAFEASAAFVGEHTADGTPVNDACVSWAPDIYKQHRRQGARHETALYHG